MMWKSASSYGWEYFDYVRGLGFESYVCQLCVVYEIMLELCVLARNINWLGDLALTWYWKGHGFKPLWVKYKSVCARNSRSFRLGEYASPKREFVCICVVWLNNSRRRGWLWFWAGVRLVHRSRGEVWDGVWSVARFPHVLYRLWQQGILRYSIEDVEHC